MRNLLITVLGGVLFLSGCATETPPEEEEMGETSSAYTGPVPVMERIAAPDGMPSSWEQPDSEGTFDQYGYCGATAAANLLTWYGKSTTPREAIDNGCWSYVGTRPPTLAAYLKKAQPELDCYYQTMKWNADSLGNLRNALAAGRPVIIEFMTGKLNAHWVTVVGVEGTEEDPYLTVMSWGGYYKIRWAGVKDAWRSAWGGYYPYVMCNAVSPLAGALR